MDDRSSPTHLPLHSSSSHLTSFDSFLFKNPPIRAQSLPCPHIILRVLTKRFYFGPAFSQGLKACRILSGGLSAFVLNLNELVEGGLDKD